MRRLKALHTLSAYATGARLTLAQLSVPEKTNESAVNRLAGGAGRLGGLQIDHQLEPGRLHDWQVGRLTRKDAGLEISQINRIHPSMPATTMMGIGLMWDFQKRSVHAAAIT
jgi:hypothetical protein